MQLCKVRKPAGQVEVGILNEGEVSFLRADARGRTLSDILHAGAPAALVSSLGDVSSAVPVETVKLLPPLDGQEVWAAGVTYKRSREARERESEGAARFYDLVYRADAPNCSSRPRRAAWSARMTPCRSARTRAGASPSRSWPSSSHRPCTSSATPSATT